MKLFYKTLKKHLTLKVKNTKLLLSELKAAFSSPLKRICYIYTLLTSQTPVSVRAGELPLSSDKSGFFVLSKLKERAMQPTNHNNPISPIDVLSKKNENRLDYCKAMLKLKKNQLKQAMRIGDQDEISECKTEINAWHSSIADFREVDSDIREAKGMFVGAFI